MNLPKLFGPCEGSAALPCAEYHAISTLVIHDIGHRQESMGAAKAERQLAAAMGPFARPAIRIDNRLTFRTFEKCLKSIWIPLYDIEQILFESRDTLSNQ